MRNIVGVSAQPVEPFPGVTWLSLPSLNVEIALPNASRSQGVRAWLPNSPSGGLRSRLQLSSLRVFPMPGRRAEVALPFIREGLKAGEFLKELNNRRPLAYS